MDHIHKLVPGLIDLEVIGQSYQGRNITSVRITNELNAQQKAKTLVVAQHHGREQITVEMALRFIQRLVNLYGADPIFTNYIDTQEIYVIPTLNPDALEVVVNLGNHWLRKNLRPFDDDNDGESDEDSPEDVDSDGHISQFTVSSLLNSSNSYSYFEGIDNDGDGLINEDGVGLVDLNRNYHPFWGILDDHHQPDTQIYAGTEPFSEPETQAFRNFAVNHKFAMAYSLHSGINSTWFATDERGGYRYPGIYREMLLDFLRILPSAFNVNTGFIPPIQNDEILAVEEVQTQLEMGQGYWKDWMCFDQGSIAPMTFEVYHNGSVDGFAANPVVFENATHSIREWKGIFGYFNPEEAYINDLWNDIRPAFSYLLNMTPRLKIDFEVTDGEGTSDKTPNARFSLQNLSPYIGTIASISVLRSDGRTIATRPAFGAPNINTNESQEIALKVDTSTENYTIRIGNNYVGFTRFTISNPPSTDDSSSPAFQFWVPLVILPLLFAVKKIQSKCQKSHTE
ncbi:MAG: M14 family zinc carboxypeptidase [Candidatus Hodarchaeales archaeon]